MALTEQDLRPYLSLVVATSDDEPAVPDSFIDDLIDACITGLGVGHDTTAQRHVIDRLPFATNGGVRSGALVYAVRRTPAWAMPSADIADVRHNLVLVAAVGSYVAIVATENDAGKRLSRRIGTGVGALGSLRRLSPGVLNAAFARGAAKTLWLSGVHRSTPTRADSKVLSGSALQAALSPVGDQSYAFTAARADSQIANLPHGEAHQVVGYSPRGSRLWIGPSKDWDWFASSVEAVLHHLALADGDEPVVAPLPYLATQSSDDVTLDDAYDIALVSPDALALAEIGDDDERARSERWTYCASFEVDTASTSGPDFDAAVVLHGEHIGTLRFKVDVASANDVRWDVVPITVADDRADDVYDAVQAVSDPAAVTIHYNTGQTVRAGAIYEIRHRDTPFTRWRFESLDNVCVRREKPMRNRSFAIDAIGAVDGDALFDWIARSWPPNAERPSEAFLASDDRANEIADFIYLDPTAEPPLVQLIHVKGSGSDAASRQLSTSDYEIVVGQAVKNLRHLDQTDLADALADGSEHAIADATWQGDTRIGNRTALIAQLRKIGANYTREVYVVQPRVTDDELARCRREHTALLEDGGTLTNRVRRLRQLDTLLLAAAADCRELGADFYVIGQATGRPCPTHGA